MRRGHPAVGGWRSDNPRHFRSGSGGGPHFRPPRPPPFMHLPRYPPLGPRPVRTQYNRHSSDDHDLHQNYDRNSYRSNNWSNTSSRHQDKPHQSQPFTRRSNDMTHHHSKSYKDQPNYYKHKSDGGNVNSMGDIDHRHPFKISESLQRRMSPWSNAPNESRHFDKRNFPPRQHRYSEGETSSMTEYTGHRPPALDHYGDPVSIIDESDTFSRSIDDTVDIVRKRLMNRNDPTTTSEHPLDIDERECNTVSEAPTSSYNLQQEQPTKKRIQRQKQTVKTNCDQIKNKIVTQLFKMDKEKIHKLMDNPSSSDKFEYAISSLVTESQNSYHRHMRSLAEKSLSSSSSEFMQNDNNTIYEDTFMKQMQCILDPQDTILLEDIKPLVMAELNKVLQLDDFDPRFGYNQNSDAYSNPDTQNFDQYPPEYYDNFPQNEIYQDTESRTYYDVNQTYNDSTSPNLNTSDEKNYYADNSEFSQKEDETDSKNFNKELNNSNNLINVLTQENIKPWEESSGVKKEISSLDERIEELRRHSYESRRLSRVSFDKPSEETYNVSDKQLPLFDTNAENVSEEDDPFADLDNQYHVPVDPSFIEPDDIEMQLEPVSPITDEVSASLVTPKKKISIKQEIENRFQTFLNSPIKLGCRDLKSKNVHPSNESNQSVKKDKHTHYEKGHSHSKPSKSSSSKINTSSKHEHSIESKLSQIDGGSLADTLTTNTADKSSVQSNSRKRSADQRPSHRKEKRKKSESSELDSNKQILNKNIIINVTDCNSGTTEKTCEKAAKSIFNLYFSKENSSKETKEPIKTEKPEKTYSDKYVKRKETPKKDRELENEDKKKGNSSSSTHSNVSPKDTSKLDAKTKLHTFDMFSEQPKKTNTYQAHRKTVIPSNITKPVDDKQSKISSSAKKHASTQVSKKSCVKETQTIPKRHVMRATQTDPVTIQKSESKETDPFLRMKEIDMEIQALLQEKFKLYNSLESQNSCPKTMENLGMTVVNVPIEKSTTPEPISADTVVEEFTDIPTEELEQIALESIDVETAEMKDVAKSEIKIRSQRVIADQRKSSESPTLKRSKRQKTKTLNISLLEQIIDDDRPLEDIISLDALEASPVKDVTPKATPVKTKKKPIKKGAKKKVTKKTKPVVHDYVQTELEHFGIKEFSIVLENVDISKYLKPNTVVKKEVVTETHKEEMTEIAEAIVTEISVGDVVVNTASENNTNDVQMPSTCSIVEEVLNDMQFDMLDVSEDIVIGEEYDKEGHLKVEHVKGDETITDEVVLDNCMPPDVSTVPEASQSETQYKIYDFSADENLKRDSKLVSGNADAVLAIECTGNDFVAACLDGNVYHFTSDGTLLSTLRGSNLAVTCLTLVKEKFGTTVYTGSLDSRIRYYDLETGMERGPECNVLSPIQTMDRAWDTIFVGTRTGFVLQFECKNNMLIPVSTVKFSDQTILALRAMKEGPRKVLLVAARSENVTIKDALSGLLLRTLEGPKMTVYTLLYVEGRVYCGTSNHHIQVFDYTSGNHVGSLVGGKGAVAVVAAGGLVFAGCYDGAVYAFRSQASSPFALFRGPTNMLLSLAVHDTKIIAGYKDRSLYIWKIPLNILKEMIL